MGKYQQTETVKGMVDISDKAITKRIAVAQGVVKMNKVAMAALVGGKSPKGDVLETAKMAGVMAAKSTPSLIPLCHPLELSKITVNPKVEKTKNRVTITSEVVSFGRTGVEMEALAAVSVAALTIYDMMKWADRGMVISEVKLLYKSGGKSGIFRGK